MDQNRLPEEISVLRTKEREMFKEIKRDLRKHEAFRSLPSFARKSAYQSAIKEHGLRTISFVR